MQKEINSDYLAVAIITYNRINHLKKLIASLQKNTFAKFTDVYVAVDFPSREQDKQANAEICEFIKGEFPEFKSFTPIIREKNYGPGPNAVALRAEILKTHKDCIFMEDDLEVAPNFLEYMNTAYDYYKDDPTVISISGYSYPIDYVVDEGATCMKQQLQMRVWGAVQYQSKYPPLREYIIQGGLVKDFDYALKSKKFNRLANFAQFTYIHNALKLLDEPNNFITRATDEAIRILLTVKGYYQVIPTKSLVKNNGYDGTGITCPDVKNWHGDFDYDYGSQKVDLGEFRFQPDTLNEFKKNKKLVNKFDTRNMFKVRLKLFFYKLLGKKLYFSIRKKIKKVK